MALERESNMYLNGKTVMICSDDTGSRADAEVLSIIKSCHKKASDILRENIDKLHKISDFLIEKETISGEEFMRILNETDNSIETI